MTSQRYRARPLLVIIYLGRDRRPLRDRRAGGRDTRRRRATAASEPRWRTTSPPSSPQPNDEIPPRCSTVGRAARGRGVFSVCLHVLRATPRRTRLRPRDGRAPGDITAGRAAEQCYRRSVRYRRHFAFGPATNVSVTIVARGTFTTARPIVRAKSACTRRGRGSRAAFSAGTRDDYGTRDSRGEIAIRAYDCSKQFVFDSGRRVFVIPR